VCDLILSLEFLAIGYFWDRLFFPAVFSDRLFLWSFLPGGNRTWHTIIMIISSNRPDSVCYLLLACFVQKLYVLATSAVRPDCKLGQHFSFDVHLVILTWLCVRSSLIFGALRGSVALSCFVRDNLTWIDVHFCHRCYSRCDIFWRQSHTNILTKWFLINYVVCVILFWHVCIEIPSFFTAEAVSRDVVCVILFWHVCIEIPSFFYGWSNQPGQ